MGSEFIEYGMGLRAVTLGHAYESVVEAAYPQMNLGVNFSRPAKIEIDLAESLLGVIDGADMVKFAKNGSDVTTAAIKLARAFTGRNMIAICGDQPFFSTDDWFIGTTEMNAGIPQSTIDLSLRFHYNDLASLQQLFDAHPKKIACVIMEPEAISVPSAGLPQASESTLRKRRRTPDLRRNDYRLPLASGRCAEIPWSGPAPFYIREGSCEWFCRFGPRRKTGDYAAWRSRP